MEKNTLHKINIRWKRTHNPQEAHVNGHTGRSKYAGENTGSPHLRDPATVGREHIRFLPTSKNAGMAVAGTEEMGELGDKEEDQPHRVDER